MLKLWTKATPEDLRRLVRPVRALFDDPPDVVGAAFHGAGVPDALVPWPQVGEVVLAMGGGPVDELKRLDQLPGNLSVNKSRGRLWPVRGDRGAGHWMVSYSPGLAQREADAWQRIRWDLALALRYLSTGTLRPKVGRYRYVRDFSGVVDAVKREADRTGERVRVFEDLETLGLWPWYRDAWIVSCQFCVKPGTADVAVFPSLGDEPSTKVLDQVEWVENADEVSLGGANLKFDNLWKRVKWRLDSPSSFKVDTLLAGGLLDENRRNSLSNHACIYVPSMGGYDAQMNELDKGRMDLIYADDPDGFLVYSGGDVDVGARAREAIVDELRDDPELRDFYVELLHPAAQAFEEVEHEGILVDEAALWEVGERARAEVREAEEEMRRFVPGRLKRKRSGTEKSDLLDFTPAVLRELFFDKALGWGLKPTVFTDKSGEASTSVDEHLKRFLDHPKAGPFLKALRKRNKAEKVASSYVGERDKDGNYVGGFLEHLRPDGRFHPTFSLYVGSQFEKDEGEDASGTNTGRVSAKNPHVQTIPNRTKPGDRDWAKELRRCYPAPPGHLVGEIDVSQGELKWHAMLAQEPTMLRLFREGKDMHAATAARSAGVSYDEFCAWEQSDPKRWKWMRYTAKPCFDGETEVLTRGGWVRLDALPEGVEVLQVWEGGAADFSLPAARHSFKDEAVWRVGDRYTDLVVTPCHRQPLVDRKGSWHTERMADHRPWRFDEWAVPHACKVRRTGRIGEWTTRLLAMVQADGSYVGDGSVRLGFSKARKVERCRWLLSAGGVAFAERGPDSKGVTTFSLGARESRRLGLPELLPGKHFDHGTAFDVDADALLDEVRYWDSHEPARGRGLVLYSNTCEADAEFVQTVAVTSGRRAVKRERGVGGNGGKLNAWEVSYTLQERPADRISWRKNGIEESVTDVYCLTVPSTYLLVRRSGKVTVSGNCNFGLLYLQSPPGFQAFAWKGYDLDYSLEECEKIHSDFFSLYPRLVGYAAHQQAQAKELGYVENPFGRVRHLPLAASSDRQARAKAFRQAVNAPTQSSLSDQCLWALAIAHRDHDLLRRGLRVFNFVHDALQFYFPDSSAGFDMARELQAIMEGLPYAKLCGGWEPELALTTDFEFGPNLAEMRAK